MRTRPLHLLSLALLAAAPAARADPVADFETGTAALVETATVDLGNGPRTSTGSGALTKPERSAPEAAGRSVHEAYQSGQ